MAIPNDTEYFRQPDAKKPWLKKHPGRGKLIPKGTKMTLSEFGADVAVFMKTKFKLYEKNCTFTNYTSPSVTPLAYCEFPMY